MSGLHVLSLASERLAAWKWGEGMRAIAISHQGTITPQHHTLICQITMRLKGASLFGPSKRSLRPKFRDYQSYPDQSPGCWLRREEGDGGGWPE